MQTPQPFQLYLDQLRYSKIMDTAVRPIVGYQLQEVVTKAMSVCPCRDRIQIEVMLCHMTEKGVIFVSYFNYWLWFNLLFVRKLMLRTFLH